MRWTDTVAIILLLLAGILTASVHWAHPGPTSTPLTGSLDDTPLGYYPYPLHIDGWHHLSLTRQLIESPETIGQNPQLHEAVPHRSYETGFHILLALLSPLVPELHDLVLFVPALLLIVGAGLLYLYCRNVLKEPLAGLLIIPLITYLPSNLNLLGNWYLVPLNLTTPLFAGLLLATHVKNETQRWLLVGALLLISLFSYPLIPLLYLPYLAITLYHEHGEQLKDKKTLIIATASIIIAGTLSLLIVTRAGLPLVFTEAWGKVQFPYKIWHLFPVMLIVTAAIGWILTRKEERRINATVIALSALFTIDTVLHVTTGQTILIPYQRLLQYWQIILAISAGIGLARIAGLATKRYKALIVGIIIVLLIAYHQPHYYEDTPNTLNLQRLITPETETLMKGIGHDETVLTEPFLASTIYPLTGSKIAAGIDANIGGGDPLLYQRFMGSPCEERQEIIKEHGITTIITISRIDCEGITLLESAGIYNRYSTR